MSRLRHEEHTSRGSAPSGTPAGSGAGAAFDDDRGELRLRAIFDHTVQFIAVLAPDGTVVEANRAALELGGLALEQVVGRPLWEGGWWEHLPDARAQLRAALERAITGETLRFELEVNGREGDGYLDFRTRPVFDEDGAVTLLIAEGRDVTETKWAERALRVSEARFAGIISIASDAIISVDEDFVITLFNQGAQAIFGYTPDEVLGQPLDILLPERFRGAHGHHMRHFAASPVVARRMGERQEIHGRRRDGTEFPAEASISKLDLFGSTVFTVVLRDITERKRIERSQRFLAQAGTILASSLEYEKTLASVAGLTVPELADWSVVYVQESDGSVRRLEVAHADPAKRPLLSRLMTYPLDPRSPHPVFTVLETGAPQVLSDIGEDFLQALAQSSEHLEIYHSLGMRSMLMVPLVARGSTRGAMGFVSATPRRYGPEEIALAMDLAVLSALAVDNARLYREAQEAVAARDDLIAVVSHDLGNPLSAIRIGTSLLLRSARGSEHDEGEAQHLEFIRQAAQQMENLINDLLEVKRLEAGKVQLNLREVAVNDVVHEVVGVFRPIAEGRGISLTWESGQPGLRIMADHRRIVQVLSNIVGNALKFTEPGGRVSVAARSGGNVVLFSVTDTGPGIAPEHIPHVFDRFWQAGRDGRKGLGLGLAIARGLVDAHGGRIWVESSLGAGTTFLFALPATSG